MKPSQREIWRQHASTTTTPAAQHGHWRVSIVTSVGPFVASMPGCRVKWTPKVAVPLRCKPKPIFVSPPSTVACNSLRWRFRCWWM
ncbi:MAG: DUF2914 domain-containing protein [Synechococcus sp. SB0662_bin_45]|nr:DUF2914 domain-containing protein [Synechococcus sp. SB0668_bin_13]MXY63558.1 DUF2914 domain-containing protein [Synechococcus sp. SB0665_bin_28]MYE21491.1 DUF2914 domain-containing protein [Synechococcus sp. SB0662_bin_45]MYF20547.1 DUF2914 domain-containing protein [Synechococcus sp. SB0677_bin_5]MYG63346.1 DUF2914 domain-containing protein [Synechococcus sp. SB0675_bin_7]MYI72693.1 DUF2914 domain-containing protein [Synechococcus sp. SB0673_bin_10]MYK85848.1 DUF2914 domain-containing pr